MKPPSDDPEARREALRRLVATKALRTQAELARALARLGFQATQSSISRDMKALGITKVAGRYELPPRPPEDRDETPDLGTVLREFGRSVAAAGENLLVIRTEPGTAQGVAHYLDGSGIAGVVGTVAGDDTIFVAVAGRRALGPILARLRRELGG